jgi:DNA-binding transcriptional ArsR family regulator
MWADDVVDLAVEVLRMLADPTRLQLAGLLLDEERSVSELAAILDKPVPGVSQHLAKMRMARLVTTRKQGTSVLYRVENGHVRQLVIDTIGHVEHLLDQVPAHHRTAEKTA